MGLKTTDPNRKPDFIKLPLKWLQREEEKASQQCGKENKHNCESSKIDEIYLDNQISDEWRKDADILYIPCWY